MKTKLHRPCHLYQVTPSHRTRCRCVCPGLGREVSRELGRRHSKPNWAGQSNCGPASRLDKARRLEAASSSMESGPACPTCPTLVGSRTVTCVAISVSRSKRTQEQVRLHVRFNIMRERVEWRQQTSIDSGMFIQSSNLAAACWQLSQVNDS